MLSTFQRGQRACARAVSAMLQFLTALCTMWLPEALSQGKGDPNSALRHLYQPCLHACTACVGAGLRQLQACSQGTLKVSHSCYFTHAAAEAALGLISVACQTPTLGQAAHHKSANVMHLIECAREVSTNPSFLVTKVPQHIRNTLWKCVAEAQAGCLARARKEALKGCLPESEWDAAAYDFTLIVQPVTALWQSLSTKLPGASSALWIANAQAMCAAAGVLVTVSEAVRHSERRVKRVFYAGLQPMMVIAAHLLCEGQQHSAPCAIALEGLLSALTTAVLTLLPEMTESDVEVVTAACLDAPGASPTRHPGSAAPLCLHFHGWSVDFQNLENV
jgi:hypothetical protein